MATTKGRIAGYWREIWQAPGPQFLEAAYRGELAAARIRIGVILFVIWIPITAYLRRPILENRLGLAVCGVTLLQAILVLLILRRRLFVRWMA